jgi:hypothetical protein
MSAGAASASTPRTPAPSSSRSGGGPTAALRQRHRRGLRRRERVGQVEHRREELVESGEGQLGLRLGARGAQQAEPVGALRRVGEQRGLAHPGGPRDDERPAAALPRTLDERRDRGLLARAPVQPHGTIVADAAARGELLRAGSAVRPARAPLG